MKGVTWLGAAALAIATLSATPAASQPGWSPPSDWGTGWREWRGRDVERTGWSGPGWYNGPGEHHGWYHYNNSWYEHCGWRWSHHRHDREWRCN